MTLVSGRFPEILNALFHTTFSPRNGSSRFIEYLSGVWGVVVMAQGKSCGINYKVAHVPISMVVTLETCKSDQPIDTDIASQTYI